MAAAVAVAIARPVGDTAALSPRALDAAASALAVGPPASPGGNQDGPPDDAEDVDKELPTPEPEFDPTQPDDQPLPLPPACRGASIRSVAALQRQVIFTGMGTSVPPSTRHALSAIKDRIVEHVTACLSALPVEAERGVVTATLKQSFDTAGVTQSDGTAGSLVSHQLAWSRHRRHVSVFTASLKLSCGADDVAIVFERNATGLRRSLVVRADGYDDIYGGNLGVEVSLSRGGDDFAIATTAASPWCTSCWRGLKYDVFTRADDGRFRRAAGGKDSAHVCSGVSTDARDGAVRFDFVSWDHLGSDVRRPRQRAFDVAGATVAAAPPTHRDPVDTVQAFLDADWTVARRMVEPPGDALKGEHQALRRDQQRGRWRASVDGDGDRVVVKLAPTRSGSDDAPRRLAMRRDGDRWLVVGIAPAARP